MTFWEMEQILVDKGHSRDWAKVEASRDSDALHWHNVVTALPRDECSICRRSFTDLQMKYHYHPCE